MSVEHLWPMVRSPKALEIVIEELEEEPGLVLYTCSTGRSPKPWRIIASTAR